MLLGFTREAAARFSFLLSVPIILGAGGYKLWKTVPVLRGEPAWALATLVGTAVSAVAGYLVIDWLLGWLRTRTTLRLRGLADRRGRRARRPHLAGRAPRRPRAADSGGAGGRARSEVAPEPLGAALTR